ncbi:MAG TPA: DUF4142 domain-containing protein [Pirellulales bacterium]|jgi:putative membrane protein|nr:DUF4142 domain-containing protein [Pirellulales bacterium]
MFASFRTMGAFTLALAPLFAVAQAAAPATPARPNQPAAANTTTAAATAHPGAMAMQSWDHFFVNAIVHANQGEIKMAKFADQHATSKEVKDFAQKMEKDHTNYISKLEEFRSNQPNKESSATSTTNRTTTTAATTATTEERASSGDQQGRLKMAMQMHEEIAQGVETALEKEFAAQGKNFDRAYIGEQIYAHLKMWETLAVFKPHASPELQKLIAAGEKTTAEHLEDARKLMKELDENQNGKTSRTSTQQSN